MSVWLLLFALTGWTFAVLFIVCAGFMNGRIADLKENRDDLLRQLARKLRDEGARGECL